MTALYIKKIIKDPSQVLMAIKGSISEKRTVVSPYLWFHFPWFQLLEVNYSLKILKRNILEVNNPHVLN